MTITNQFSTGIFLWCMLLSTVLSVLGDGDSSVKQTTDRPIAVKALVINLPEDNERRDHSAGLLKKLDISFDIVAAIRPNASLVGKVRNQGALKLTSDFQSYSELGCFMSHQKALGQAAVFPGISIIFEDDNYPLMPLTAIRDYITSALSEAPSGWDIIYLGWCSELCTFEEPVSEHLQTAVAPLCTHAFALSQTGAMKVSAVLKRGGRPNDVDLRLAILNGELNAFKTNEPLFDQIKNLGDTAAAKIATAMGTAQDIPTTGLTNSHNLNPQTQLCHPESGSNFRSVVDNMMDSMQGWREKMVMHRASSLQGRKQLKLLMPKSAVEASKDTSLLARIKQLEHINGTKGFREVYADVDRMVEALHKRAAATRLRRSGSDPCEIYGAAGVYGGAVGYGISDYGFTCGPTDQPTSAPTNAPLDQPTNAPLDQPTNAPTDQPTSSPTVRRGKMGKGMSGKGMSGKGMSGKGKNDNGMSGKGKNDNGMSGKGMSGKGMSDSDQ